MEDIDALARLVDALRPWLDRLVFVGGWHTDCIVCTLPPVFRRMRRSGRVMLTWRSRSAGACKAT